MPPDRARFDVNNDKTLMAVSNVDGETPVTLWADPSTHKLITDASGGGGGGGVVQLASGADVTLLATVVDYAGYKPLAVIPVDSAGGAIVLSDLPGMQGLVVDGVTSSTKATVFARATSNPQAVAIVDANGNQFNTFNANNTIADGADPTLIASVIDPNNPVSPSLGLGVVLLDSSGSPDYNLQAINDNQLSGDQLVQLIDNNAAVYVSAIPASGLTDAFPVQIVDGSGNQITSFGSGSVTVSNGSGGAAVNIQDGGNSITVDGSITANIGTTNGLALDATLTGGTQQTKITDGTNIANVLKSDGTTAAKNSQLVAGINQEATWSVTSVSNGTSYDVSGYRSISIHVLTQYTGSTPTVNFWQSNDNTNWVPLALVKPDNSLSSNSTSTTQSNVMFTGPLTSRYFRLTFTGTYSSSTSTGVIEFFTHANPNLVSIAGQIALNGTQSVNTTSGTGAAVPANAFYIGVNGSGNLTGINAISNVTDGVNGTGTVATSPTFFNGTNQDRGRSIINATNSVGTGIQAVGIIGQFDDVSPTAITENQFGNIRMSANRNLYGTIRDAAGNERGVNVTSGNALQADLTSIAGTATSTGVGATGSGVLRVVEANGAGRTLASAGGAASSSGNNTLVAAGTNKLKVYAFSLTTTSTTSVTCIFQSGASGTELWRVVLQAPTSVNVGANLAVTVPAYLFSTAGATLLNLNLSAAQTVHWSVAYYDEA